MLFRGHQKAILAAVLLLLAAATVDAQSWAGKGRLQGFVEDPQGKPVEKAKVTFLKGEGDKAVGPNPIYSDKNGKWSILGLASGPWRVLIEKEGYQNSEGSVQVNEFVIAQPIHVQLKDIPKQVQEQAKQKSQGQEAVDAIEQGNTLLQAGKPSEARAEYEKALPKLEPANQPAVLRGVARTYYEEKNTAKAVETLKSALEIQPDDVESLKLIINLLVVSGKDQEAKVYMAKLPQGTTVDTDSLLNMGITSYNQGVKGKGNKEKLGEALSDFDRVVKEHPDSADGYYYRGLVYLAQNNMAAAKADFQKVLEVNPNYAKAAEVKEFIKSL